MNEEMFFLPAAIPELFIHAHYPEATNTLCNNVFIFLNPVLDEKKRVQQFQAQTARAICQLGIPVYRFDYYGSGDSKGESYNFEFQRITDDVDLLIQHIKQKYGECRICLLGIRLGADIVASIASKNSHITHLFLVEPVFKGSKFLSEQRVRRKIFQKINNMNIVDDLVVIDGIKCEDFQGYLMAPKAVNFLEELDIINLPLSGKYIYLYKLDNMFSVKNYKLFMENIKHENKHMLINVAVPDFWSKLEATNTIQLTGQIVETLNSIA